MIVADGPFQQLWNYVCDGPIISVATTPNCSLIVAVTVGCNVFLLNGEGQSVWKKPFSLQYEGWATAISADGNIIVVGSANKNPSDGYVHVLDRAQCLLWTKNFTAPVWGVSLSKDGKHLAVSTWDNKAWKFIRQKSGYEFEYVREFPKGHGLYGIRLSEDGCICVVCSYDQGVIVLDEKWEIISELSITNGLYNVAISTEGSVLVAGLRDGAIVLASVNKPHDKQILKIAPRPISGVSISADGNILALGSFDGKLYVLTRTGYHLWQYETNGEIWSTATSVDGGLICIGSGDHSVRLFENRCSCAAVCEMEAAELSLAAFNSATLESTLEHLEKLYLQYGAVQYAYKNLLQYSNRKDWSVIEQSLIRILEADIKPYPHHFQSHFQLAQLLHNSRPIIAVHHYQEAAEDSSLRSQSLINAADCLLLLGLPTASAASSRRAREQQLDPEAKKILFNLARSYQDKGDWDAAFSHFQILISWDVMFRDAYSRLESVQNTKDKNSLDAPASRIDYTGLTISLLGPDVPRDIDKKLNVILEARKAEVLIKSGEQREIENIVNFLITNPQYIPSITGRANLEYSIQAFLQYDFAPPEDEIKKFLETVNLLFLLNDSKNVKDTLDIGSASGRYPLLFDKLGKKSHGVDISPKAVEFAEKKRGDKEWPKFYQGDARELNFNDESFDLVTCMMGTFAHISNEDHKKIMSQAFRVLRPGGIFVISTWDVECKHLAYLAMYNESEKEVIRQKSPTQAEMISLFQQNNFCDTMIRPFCLFPQGVLYDLGLDKLRSEDIKTAAKADLAARALYAGKHGEMFLAYARKPE